MTLLGTPPQVKSLLHCHVSPKYFHISSEGWAAIKGWATIISIVQTWTVDIIHEEETIRFSSTSVCKVIAAWSSDFHKCLCIQFFDNWSQITVATIGEEPLNYIGHLSSTLHLQHFYYLLKLAELQWLGNSYLIKISFSIQKTKNKLPALKEKSCYLQQVIQVN